MTLYRCVRNHYGIEIPLSALEIILDRDYSHEFVTIPERLPRGVPFYDYWLSHGCFSAS